MTTMPPTSSAPEAGRTAQPAPGLRLAIPSKGRLLEPTLSFLEACGFAVKGARGSRDYTASIPALPDAIVDLTAASEIPDRLAAGGVNLAVTGLDLVAERLGAMPPTIETVDRNDNQAPVVVRGLGFGRADLVIAVPRAWIDVDSMADLADVARMYRRRHGRRMRVATKYRALAQGFFAHHNVLEYRLVRSGGATEAAPATGAADIIVDITSTGQTLAANHLKTLRDGTILSSEATLFVTGAKEAQWSETALAQLNRLLDMVDAKTNAASRKLVLCRLPNPAEGSSGAPALPERIAALENELEGLVHSRVEFMQGALSGAVASGAQALSVMLTAPAARIYDVVSILRKHGTREIIVHDTDYVFDTEQSSFALVRNALGLKG